VEAAAVAHTKMKKSSNIATLMEVVEDAALAADAIDLALLTIKNRQLIF